MAEHSHIEWTDATWNTITGCSVVSPGCTNCYAMKLAGTRLQHHPSRAGLTVDSKAGPVWNGQVRLNEDWLTHPLQWKRPRRIFVCAHGDLFHESVPDEWIDRVFAVMALSPQHTFQVLTKRAARMRAYCSDPAVVRRVYLLACDLTVELEPGVVLIAPGMDERLAPNGPRVFLDTWPLPNVWMGVSAEDQARADERIPDLLATPAAVRFLSAEPLLGAIDLRRIELRRHGELPNDRSNRLGDYVQPLRGSFTDSPRIGWVIVGGESGPGARPMHPDWARQIREACAAAGVPFFFKQWGAWFPYGERDADGNVNVVDKGERPGLFREWENGGFSVRLGKKAAGRFLDGVTHDAMPAGAA